MIDYNKADNAWKELDELDKLDLIYLSNIYYDFGTDDKDEVSPSYFEKSNNGLYYSTKEDKRGPRDLFNCSLDLCTLFNNHTHVIFDVAKALKTPQYPMVVLGEISYFDRVFKEEEIIHTWAYIQNETEFADYKKSQRKNFKITYMFDIKDDIYEDIYNKTKALIDTAEEVIDQHIMRTIKVKGDVLITDPCYFFKREDWGVFDAFYRFDDIGIHNSLCRGTIYGDWSCTVLDKDKKNVLGTFCADSGMVSVCLLDEVLKYSGDKIKPYIENGSACVIKDFDGEIHFEVRNEENLVIVGTGNKPFITLQTGL